MNAQQTLATMGFEIEQTGGGCVAMVWRGAEYTWVATSTDGCMLPSDDDWLICEYRAGDWDAGKPDNRSFDSDGHYLSDVIAAMLA